MAPICLCSTDPCPRHPIAFLCIKLLFAFTCITCRFCESLSQVFQQKDIGTSVSIEHLTSASNHILR